MLLKIVKGLHTPPCTWALGNGLKSLSPNQARQTMSGAHPAMGFKHDLLISLGRWGTPLDPGILPETND
jgi:hypothetical protein